MKILITGAYGQLGSELKILSGKFPVWQFLFTDVDLLDITNEIAVQNYLFQNKPDFVVNSAAYTAVDKAESDIETAWKINANAPGILASETKRIGAKFIHISTDYVFDGNANKPYREDDAVNPTGIYGKSKLAGEENVLKGNPASIIIRTSWLYSAFGNNFVKTMLQLAKERGSVNVVFDQVGTPTYAADLAKTILAIIEIFEKENEKFVPGIYHYSNEGVASWYDFALAVFEISGEKCVVKPVFSEEFPTPAKRPSYSVLDKSKIKNTFAINVPYWRNSLKNCIEKL